MGVGSSAQSPADPLACRMVTRTGTIDIQRQLPSCLSAEFCPLSTLGLGAGDLGLMTLQPGSFLYSLPLQPPDQSSGWMCTSQPSWSTYQTETGLVELSIQDSRSMLNGSGSV